ncbi:unnamed protein product [Cuscuta epithymum]|uniref:Uncharacterized protein n=1 Tax=Cuscuta epithymum TaxID=186058 RepID=A0AAV0EI43_9ASTE|nr:unnamed protein product [Cuscuta epithymum]
MDGVNPFYAGSSSFNYANSSKDGEILTTYRPISPEPELTPLVGVGARGDAGEGSSSVNAFPESIINSPYLWNVWSHLQARPTQSWERSGSSAFSLPIPFKKVSLLCGTPLQDNYPIGLFDRISTHWNLSPRGMEISVQASTGTSRINLNREVSRIPMEIDFMPRLSRCRSERKLGVITPKPVRPVRSTIFVGCMDVVEEESSDTLEMVILKTAKEIEGEAEAEHHPVVVSDMNNKVRLANSAYKKMVGQPECIWLDCMPPSCNPCNRIGGEVVLRILDSDDAYGGGGAVALSNRFICRVMIEWKVMNKKKSVRASCDAMKLACQSKNYVFQWKFHMITKNLPPSRARNKLI